MVWCAGMNCCMANKHHIHAPNLNYDMEMMYTYNAHASCHTQVLWMIQQFIEDAMPDIFYESPLNQLIRNELL